MVSGPLAPAVGSFGAREDDGKWTPCSVMSSRFDASIIPDRPGQLSEMWSRPLKDLKVPSTKMTRTLGV